jgi:Glyoxalase-like domain
MIQRDAETVCQERRADVQVEAILIETARPEELADCYRLGFGLDMPGARDATHLGFRVGPVYLGLERAEGPPAAGPVSIWFRVDSAESSYARLLELGGKPRSAPHRQGAKTIASVTDPDGNTVGLLSS